MKILLIGGAGFIGKSLLRALVSRRLSCEIFVLDHFDTQIHGFCKDLAISNFQAEFPSVRLIPDDLKNIASYVELTDVDSIFNMASSTGTAQSMYSYQEYFQNNVVAHIPLVTLIASNHFVDLKKYINLSSRAVYGEGSYFCPIHGSHHGLRRSLKQLRLHQWELLCPYCGGQMTPLAVGRNTIPSPTSIYGLTKLCQENLTSQFITNLDIATINLRLQNIYGPGQSLGNPYTGVLNTFIKSALSGKMIELYEQGGMTRDFLYMSDLSEILVNCLLLDIKTGIYNVGSGQAINFLSLAELISSVVVGAKYQRCNKFRFGDVRHVSADIDMESKMFSGVRFTSLKAGIEKLTSYIQECGTYSSTGAEEYDLLPSHLK